MEHVFGPVPSRRLGQSLGIDPVPFKTCNWNCVYCQLGRSSPLFNQRQSFFPAEEVVNEVKRALESHALGTIDWITFAGSGEPTLHAELGRMIGDLKSLTDIPIAVITNGSLLYLPQVRQELLLADAVLPTLDAGNDTLYRKINRPSAELSFERLVDGLTQFRREYGGKLWIEVMLIKDMNDSEEALREIAAVIEKIGPDEVHLNLPIRPPADVWVEPTDEEGLMRAAAMLGEFAHVVQPTAGEIDLSGFDNVVEAVIALITRHPVRETELLEALNRWAPDDVEQTLQELADSGRANVVTRFGERHWCAAEAKHLDQCANDRAHEKTG